MSVVEALERQDSEVPRTVGRYLLYGELASGGMATVHFGRLSGPVGFSRTVAIKRLHPHFAKDPEFVSMFLDEARLCARIRHPNVVPTVDVVAAREEIFLVMEYVAGESLSRLLKMAWTRGIPMPPRVAASIVASMLHGLHAAHIAKDEHGRHLGIVHRDVSPQNVLVGTDGIARVLDFGVAKAAGRMQTTRDGQVKGKIAYMPPEQLNGGVVTQKADTYAAAVVLWEALCSRRLFDGETEALVLVRAIEGRVDPPSVWNSTLSSAIDGVLMRGLARDPANRFENAREMAVAIEQVFGLASPSEVGEWVEMIGGDELARRAARVADIETSSIRGPSAPRITVATPQPPDVHSQVSSISVSRPAITTSSIKKRGGIGPTLSFGLLGIASFVLGGLAVSGVFSGGSIRTKPNAFSSERRGIAVVTPPTFTAKSAPQVTATPPVRQNPIVSQPPPPVIPKRVVTNPCDPPYTIDEATGRRKYKLECLK